MQTAGKDDMVARRRHNAVSAFLFYFPFYGYVRHLVWVKLNLRGSALAEFCTCRFPQTVIYRCPVLRKPPRRKSRRIFATT